MTTPIFNQGVSFFDTSTASPTGILPLQTDPAQPVVAGTARATNMLIPGAPTSEQLVNFPEELYDLRDSSNLVRVMRVFLGDSGTGQLRKRMLVTRLEAALSGANFFDLDRFYGAVFGALRNPAEALSVNPMNDVATPDEWDALTAADASFRERIGNLAKAIEMGATVPGLMQAAEALIEAPVDIYETWQLLDAYGSAVFNTPRTWDQVQAAYPTWNTFQATDTWNVVSGILPVGRTNTLTRAEIVIRPHKDYTSSPEAISQFPADESALVRVLEKLKPAGTIVTVDPSMGFTYIPVDIRGAQADSTYWEVIQKVSPRADLNGDPTAYYPLSAAQLAAGVQPLDTRVLPGPPLSSAQGKNWTYNAAVSAVTSYSFAAPDPLDSAEPQNATPSPVTDDQTVVFRDGTSVVYAASKGVLPASTAVSAAASADGSLVAHPYTGDRKATVSHD